MGGSSTFSTGGESYNWRGDKKVTKRSAKSYAATDRRVYTGRSSRGLKPPIGMNIRSNSKTPVTLILDDTGSMERMPAYLLERVPTLYHEINGAFLGYKAEELAKKTPVEIPLETELSIIAVGDAYSDARPLQVLDFKKDKELARDINKIYPEGGGGGGLRESYELGAYFLLNHCETPEAVIKPLCVIFGDETFYDRVDRKQVKDLMGDNLRQDLDSHDVFRQLQEKFDTYVLRPELYYSKEQYAGIDKKWKSVFPEERVMRMPDPEAIVNVMILIAGKASDHIQEATGLLERREDQWEIDQALETVHPLLKTKNKK